MERSPGFKKIKIDSSATVAVTSISFFAQPADDISFPSSGTAGKYNCKNTGNNEEQHRRMLHNCMV
jgi:hypothetical protein